MLCGAHEWKWSFSGYTYRMGTKPHKQRCPRYYMFLQWSCPFVSSSSRKHWPMNVKLCISLYMTNISREIGLFYVVSNVVQTCHPPWKIVLSYRVLVDRLFRPPERRPNVLLLNFFYSLPSLRNRWAAAPPRQNGGFGCLDLGWTWKLHSHIWHLTSSSNFTKGSHKTVFWGDVENVVNFFGGKSAPQRKSWLCPWLRVTWLKDFLTSKWPGSFTALAPPLRQCAGFVHPGHISISSCNAFEFIIEVVRYIAPLLDTVVGHDWLSKA